MKQKIFKKLPRTFAVIGGYGKMGRIVVKDLFESHKENHIIIIGRDEKKMKTAVRAYKSERVSGQAVDVTNLKALTHALHDVSVVINCLQYELNLTVMKACLKAQVHYIDLGGLFHMTRKQRRLDTQFRHKKLIALLGMGAAPGITNLLARIGVEKMDKVEKIEIRVGSVDHTKIKKPAPLAAGYSLQTILEEFSKKPAVLRKGKFVFLEPGSNREEHHFPDPVGTQFPFCTLHSEVFNLATTYASKGLKELTFKIAFNETFIEKIRFLKTLGLTDEKPIDYKGQKIVPREFLLALVTKLPPEIRGVPREYEILRAIVSGTHKKKKMTYTMDCHTKGMPRWRMGIDTDTGVPPSIAAQFITQGKIKQYGALFPEECMPLAPFFKELRKRRMFVKVRKESFR